MFHYKNRAIYPLSYINLCLCLEAVILGKHTFRIIMSLDECTHSLCYFPPNLPQYFFPQIYFDVNMSISAFSICQVFLFHLFISFLSMPLNLKYIIYNNV